jgi:nitrite reductase/ring-hydroxylating ferredoxin subunit
MLISAGQPTRSLRTFRDHLIVGGEGHQTGAADARPQRYEALVEFARRHFDIGPDAAYRWSTQDGMPVDSLPYIGPYTPGSKHLYVAAGFMKWGMTNATIAATLLADLITDRDNPYAARFDPNRVSLRALPKTAKLNLHAGREFFGARATPAEAPSSADVPAGEARVVRSGGGKIGVFRDDDGRVHGVSLRCTHLGCLVRFNDAERSWDCPCHGSRFDVDGALLAGPATKPLDPRDV